MLRRRLDRTAVAWQHGAVGIPIIFGWDGKIKRTGASFAAACSHCGRVVTMYEAVKHTNVHVFFAISLWDDEESVVQCGECLGLFTEASADQIRALAQPAPSLLASVASALSSVLPSRSAAPPPSPRASAAPAPAKRPSGRPPIDDASIDAELVAMKKRLGK